MVDHTIVHFDIPVKDVEKMKKFYSELLNWKIFRAPGPIDYWLIETVPVDEQGMTVRPGVNGGMYKNEHPEFKPVNYILIEDIDEYIPKIKQLGGTITQPKQEVLGVGWIASAIDPEGNAFAIMQTMR
jgi:predicted enzyme related to lactoylglutathione lyase